MKVKWGSINIWREDFSPGSWRCSPELVNIYFSPKQRGFWPRINYSQMKLPNFGSPSGDSLSKIGRHFSNKVEF